MGGAQPLAAAMCGATFIGIEVDPARAKRRVEQGYLDLLAPSLDEALREAQRSMERGEGRSIGVVGNAGEGLGGGAACATRSLILGSCRLTSGRSSARGKDPSVGWRSRAIRRTSWSPIARSWTRSRRRRTCAAG